MSNFSMREQLLITFMFLLVFVLAGMWGMQQLNLQKKLLLQQLDKLEYQIKQVRALSSEWKEVQRTPTAPVLQQALSSFLEIIARSLENQDKLQLN